MSEAGYGDQTASLCPLETHLGSVHGSGKMVKFPAPSGAAANKQSLLEGL